MAKRKRAIDEAAEYRQKVVALYAGFADPWTIPGQYAHPNRRVIYLQLLGKERAMKLFRTIGKHTQHEHANGLTSWGFDDCILSLPTGERLIALGCSRYGATKKEQGQDFSRQLDFSAEVMRGFASSTGRLWAHIRTDGSQLLDVSDGRCIPLAACSGRPLTPADD